MGTDFVSSQNAIDRPGLAHALLNNMETGETIEFMINPTEVRIALSVNWQTPAPLMRAPAGPLIYQNTQPKEFTIRAFVDQELFPDRNIMDWLAFLESLCYPVRRGDVIADPPTVLFVWPGLLALPCKMVGPKHRFNDFGTDLHPRSFQSDIVLREYGDLLRWSDEERTRIVITEGIL